MIIKLNLIKNRKSKRSGNLIVIKKKIPKRKNHPKMRASRRRKRSRKS
jgi:hypothetical protein